jgi:hypothetical protein
MDGNVGRRQGVPEVHRRNDRMEIERAMGAQPVEKPERVGKKQLDERARSMPTPT